MKISLKSQKGSKKNRQYRKNVQKKALTQKHYLKSFDSEKYGRLYEQNWAQSNISKFHNSIQFHIYHCTACHEAWPLKSQPKTLEGYVCARCLRDKKSPKKFFKGKCNDSIPSTL